MNAPITYIVANSIDECNFILGFPYTKLRNEAKYAGMTIYPNILISCHPNHLHELTHSLFTPLYQNTPRLFHEGIATYYGGSASKDFKENVELLKIYLLEHPNINLADFDSYDVLLKDGTNPFYTVGALIIEHALKTGGADKVLKLFQYTTINEAFEKVFNVPSTEIHKYIHNLIIKK